MPSLTPAIVPGGAPDEVTMSGGRRTRGATAKQLKKMLKRAGLKTTGRKAALTRRANKAHLKIRGGANGEVVGLGDKPVDKEEPTMGARRRKSRKSRGFRLY